MNHILIRFGTYLFVALIGSRAMNLMVPILSVGDCLSYLMLCAILAEVLDWKYQSEQTGENDEQVDS